MKSIFKKILKESDNRKHIFTICKKIDSYLIKKKWKEDFFGESGSDEMAEVYGYMLTILMDEYGYDVSESREILGVYYETYKDVASDDITDPDDIVIPKKSRYESFFNVYVRGHQSGRMKTTDKVYSPAEAAFEIKIEGNYEKTLENDDTEWDDWEIEDPHKINY